MLRTTFLAPGAKGSQIKTPSTKTSRRKVSGLIMLILGMGPLLAGCHDYNLFAAERGGKNEAQIHHSLETYSDDQGIDKLKEAIADADIQHISLDWRNKTDMRPLDLAAARDQPMAAEVLVAAGSNIWATNTDGDSVIHFAVRARSVKVIRALRHFMPNLNKRNNDGMTPLDLAKFYHYDDVAAALQEPFTAKLN